MKGFKFSKVGLLILAAGAFIVVLAGLGITRYGQISEQDTLSGELSLSEIRLNNMDINPYQLQLVELQEQLKDSESQLEEAKSRLIQTVISVDVTDKFYEVASYHNVIIDNLSTTKNQTSTYEDVTCLLITINAAVTGDLSHIIDFIAGLNDNFDTGFVQSTQIAIEDDTAEDGTTANIMMVVYTYEGSQ
ncbi:MAG: hypothetical protein A2Z15_00450 [Chloroflexi bacterium RBG_16_50_11]|nr:MAG: hypothetical protein A2Z15_00450 [Chloroflexi bacterium RBG_16_50_11]